MDKYAQPLFVWDVSTHPCPYFNCGLAKLPLNLGHRWVTFALLYVSFHVLISVLFLAKKVHPDTLNCRSKNLSAYEEIIVEYFHILIRIFLLAHPIAPRAIYITNRHL